MTPTPEKAAPIPADGLVDAVAKAISRHGYTEQVKGDGFAWWWNSLHDHPGNVFAHECREDDRAKARLALQVIMQDRAARASQEERIREDDERDSPANLAKRVLAIREHLRHERADGVALGTLLIVARTLAALRGDAS